MPGLIPKASEIHVYDNSLPIRKETRSEKTGRPKRRESGRENISRYASTGQAFDFRYFGKSSTGKAIFLKLYNIACLNNFRVATFHD